PQRRLSAKQLRPGENPRRTAVLAPCELEMRHLWRGDRPHELEPMQIIPDPIEQPLPAAEERRHEVDLHLVHEAGRQILLGGIRSAGERYDITVGRPPRLFERRLDALGDEREGRSAFELDWFARVMGEHEHGMMERRVDSPPAIPRLLGIPGTRVAAEHVAPHHGGPDVSERILDNARAFVDLAALKALHRAPDGEWKHPLVQRHTANPEGVVDALARTGNEAVERHRDLEAQPGHAISRSTEHLPLVRRHPGSFAERAV